MIQSTNLLPIFRLFSIAVFALVSLCAFTINAEDLLTLNNAVAKVGIDRDRGGAITWLSSAAYPNNIVNFADPGRLIQQSYYAGKSLNRTAEGQSESWSPWAWNPIQGGGVGSWARVSEFKITDDRNTLYAETIPKLWDMPDEEADARMRQWTAFEPDMPNVVVVRNELVCGRDPNDAWGPAAIRPQEIPACYFTRNFEQVKTYLGDGKWRVETQAPGPPWGKATPPLNVMAFFEKGGNGVAVFSPCSIGHWNFGPHGPGVSDDPMAGPCMHVAPLDRVNLGPDSTYRFRYWLIVGDETSIAARLDLLLARYADETSELIQSNTIEAEVKIETDVLPQAQIKPMPDPIKKPNILFIAVDDLNDYISPLDNQPGVKTPNFERLAKRSVTFTNAHCAAPACHASRVAMMTGVQPATSGIYTNLFGAHGPRWRDESPVLKNAVVLSQHFRDHGYYAAGAGKIFHTLQWTSGDSQNDPEAWDEYRGDPLDPISKDWPRPELIPDATAGLSPGRPLGPRQLFGAQPLLVPDDETGDHMVVDWAVEQLAKSHSQPLFLAVGLFRPHIPFEVPQKYYDMHPLDQIKLPEFREDDLSDARPPERKNWHQWVTKNDQWKKMMQGYLASISYTDHQLGRLLDALDASPLKDNTIVVLWSDHGFHVGEKENWEKFALWDQTTRVPLFIHAPGVSADGKSTRQPVTLTDVYPTLCELAGLPVPEQCDGLSFVAQLKAPATPRERLSLTSYCFGSDKVASHAVSDPRYRFIRYADGFEELYDLENDPNEFANLADDPKLSEVKTRLAQGLPTNAAPRRGVPADSKFNGSRGKLKKSLPNQSHSRLKLGS